MIPRLAVFLILAAFVLAFVVFACNLEDGEGEILSPRTTAPADTCKPPTCYPDPRPPKPPRL